MNTLGFKTEPASDRMLEPHTRILVDGEVCGTIVYDVADDVFDIWISVKKTEEDEKSAIDWKWLHFRERPSTPLSAVTLVKSLFDKLLTTHKLHFHP